MTHKVSKSYTTSMAGGKGGMHTPHNGGQCASDCKMNSKIPHSGKAAAGGVKAKGGGRGGRGGGY